MLHGKARWSSSIDKVKIEHTTSREEGGGQGLRCGSLMVGMKTLSISETTGSLTRWHFWHQAILFITRERPSLLCYLMDQSI